jgi:hypothetical protein
MCRINILSIARIYKIDDKWINMYTALLEWYRHVKAYVPKQNLLQLCIAYQNSHMERSGIKPGPPWWEAKD